MRFISVRDLRSKSRQVWKVLSTQKDVIVTSKGRPIAMLSYVSEDSVEETLLAIRKARAIQAVEAMQLSSCSVGTDRISLNEINSEIRAVRKPRPR